MKKNNHTNSLPAKILGISGSIIGLLLFGYFFGNLFGTILGGWLGYKIGKKSGAWLSVKTATFIAFFSGSVILLLRLLGFKVVEVVFEKFIENIFF